MSYNMISNYTFYNEIDNTNNHIYEIFISMDVSNIGIILNDKLLSLFISDLFNTLYDDLPILLQNEV